VISRFFPAGLATSLLRRNQRLDASCPNLRAAVESRPREISFAEPSTSRCRFDCRHRRVEVAFRHLIVRRIGNKLSFDATDADGAERPGPRNVAEHQRRRRAHERGMSGFVLTIGAQQDALHLDFIIPAPGEQGADWPVGRRQVRIPFPSDVLRV